MLVVLVPARGGGAEEPAAPARGREMKTVGVILALAGALALQTTLAGLTIGGATAVNLVLVAVIYVALAFGPVAGLLAGTVGGLVQDALAGGIVGIGGLSKTLVGFLVGRAGRAVHRVAAAAAVRDVRRRRRSCTSCAFRRCTRWSSRARSGCTWSATLTQALVNGADRDPGVPARRARPRTAAAPARARRYT